MKRVVVHADGLPIRGNRIFGLVLFAKKSVAEID